MYVAWGVWAPVGVAPSSLSIYLLPHSSPPLPFLHSLPHAPAAPHPTPPHPSLPTHLIGSRTCAERLAARRRADLARGARRVAVVKRRPRHVGAGTSRASCAGAAPAAASAAGRCPVRARAARRRRLSRGHQQRTRRARVLACPRNARGAKHLHELCACHTLNCSRWRAAWVAQPLPFERCHSSSWVLQQKMHKDASLPVCTGRYVCLHSVEAYILSSFIIYAQVLDKQSTPGSGRRRLQIWPEAVGGRALHG